MLFFIMLNGKHAITFFLILIKANAQGMFREQGPKWDGKNNGFIIKIDVFFH